VVKEEKAEASLGGKLKIGTAGWSYPDWDGVVFPKKKGSGFDPLTYLSEYLDVVEVNVTFYRIITLEMARRWIARVKMKPDFRFTVKLFRGFTHQKDLLSEDTEDEFKRGISPLAESGMLDAVLIQFPWSFRNTEENREYLISLIRRFACYSLAIEVRHSSWDHQGTFDLLREEGVSFCNIDQPVISRSIGPTSEVTARVAYVRLHGQNYDDWFRDDAGRDERYNYFYSREELYPWLKRIVKMAKKAEKTIVITNNHYQGQAVANALELKSLLLGEKVKVPEPLLSSFPRLSDISREGPAQPSLF
jgi:uncharacterized protein YecE (DUF72 family)